MKDGWGGDLTTGKLKKPVFCFFPNHNPCMADDPSALRHPSAYINPMMIAFISTIKTQESFSASFFLPHREFRSVMAPSRKCFILAFFIVFSFSSMNISLAARHLLQTTVPSIPTLPVVPTLPRPTLPPLPAIPTLPQPTLPTTQPSLPRPTLPPFPSFPTIPTSIPNFNLPPLPTIPSFPTIPTTIPSIPFLSPPPTTKSPWFMIRNRQMDHFAVWISMDVTYISRTLFNLFQSKFVLLDRVSATFFYCWISLFGNTVLSLLFARIFHCMEN